MFLFFTLRLSNLVTLNTTKRKEKKRTERYGTEVNTVQFIETSDFARNSNFLQISRRSYVNRTTVPKFELDLIGVETREAKDRVLSRINFFFFSIRHNVNLIFDFIITLVTLFFLHFFFPVSLNYYFFFFF